MDDSKRCGFGAGTADLGVRLGGGGGGGQRAAGGGGAVLRGNSVPVAVDVPGSSLGSTSTASTSRNWFFCRRALDLFRSTSVSSVSRSDVNWARTHFSRADL